jgi:hypothetical protein
MGGRRNKGMGEVEKIRKMGKQRNEEVEKMGEWGGGEMRRMTGVLQCEVR